MEWGIMPRRHQQIGSDGPLTRLATTLSVMYGFVRMVAHILFDNIWR